MPSDSSKVKKNRKAFNKRMFHVSKHFFKGKESCLEKYRKKFPLGALWHIYHSIWKMGKNIINTNSWDPIIEHGRGLEGWLGTRSLLLLLWTKVQFLSTQVRPLTTTCSFRGPTPSSDLYRHLTSIHTPTHKHSHIDTLKQ